ncbi:MAG: carboxypeptidase-like regulatory domain-containing protein, partial [Cyclobacteriaceae bacterium]
VLDADSMSPLPSAHVILNGVQGTTPDQDGKFAISLNRQDTILITHVGYRDYLIPILADLNGDKYYVRVLMSKALIELEEVVIYRWPSTLASFKEEVLAMEVPMEERISIPGSYDGPRRPSKTKISSPISFLYQKFSRAAKQQRRFEATKAKMERHRLIDSKYHPELVKEVTGIKDEKELDAFMAFCNLTDNFIEKSNQYDLLAAINQCYDRYQQHPN